MIHYRPDYRRRTTEVTMSRASPVFFAEVLVMIPGGVRRRVGGFAIYMESRTGIRLYRRIRDKRKERGVGGVVALYFKPHLFYGYRVGLSGSAFRMTVVAATDEYFAGARNAFRVAVNDSAYFWVAQVSFVYREMTEHCGEFVGTVSVYIVGSIVVVLFRVCYISFRS